MNIIFVFREKGLKIYFICSLPVIIFLISFYFIQNWLWYVSIWQIKICNLFSKDYLFSFAIAKIYSVFMNYVSVGLLYVEIPVCLADWNDYFFILKYFISHLHWETVLKVENAGLANVFYLGTCLANLCFFPSAFSPTFPFENSERSRAYLINFIMIIRTFPNKVFCLILFFWIITLHSFPAGSFN